MKRFWDKVAIIPFHECWEWTACKNKSGYGDFDTGLAHRVSWQIHFGPIPKGMVICHKCDNRGCVNPDHLFLGTQYDNLTDMRTKGRNKDFINSKNSFKGENSKAAKLTEKQVKDIHKIHQDKKITLTDLSKQFHVSISTIGNIVNRKIWKHI